MTEMHSDAAFSNDQPPFHPSGSAEINTVRHEVKTSPTSGDNYRRRALLLFMWLSALQQQGADTRPFTDVDKRYYGLEGQIVTAAESETTEFDAAGERALLAEMAALIDEGFGVMELCIYRDKVFVLVADGYLHAIK